jgi:predicted nucleic acid-binding Zn ribbon protein
MRQNNEMKLGDAIMAYLKAMGLERKMLEHRLINSWADTLGKAVANNTGNLYIYKGVLFVELRSALIRQELLMMKTALIERLNQNVGQKIITDIVFR